MRIRRTISVLPSIKRWTSKVSKCVWNGAQLAASIALHGALTAQCVTTVWRYTHTHTIQLHILAIIYNNVCYNNTCGICLNCYQLPLDIFAHLFSLNALQLLSVYSKMYLTYGSNEESAIDCIMMVRLPNNAQFRLRILTIIVLGWTTALDGEITAISSSFCYHLPLTSSMYLVSAWSMSCTTSSSWTHHILLLRILFLAYRSCKYPLTVLLFWLCRLLWSQLLNLL